MFETEIIPNVIDWFIICADINLAAEHIRVLVKARPLSGAVHIGFAPEDIIYLPGYKVADPIW